MGAYVNDFSDWTGDRTVHCIGTNSRSEQLPFQMWHHFKEAFAPELLKRALEESTIKVKTCLDPFGGSGTTALACQFLGIEPTTIEINPYLADLIEAKLQSYDADALTRDFGRILTRSRVSTPDAQWSSCLPPTFIQPGDKDRWIFNKAVADEVLRLRAAIGTLKDQAHQRFFRIQLGGILVAVSNVRISGKGRRYRSNWLQREASADHVRALFTGAVQNAIVEAHRYGSRTTKKYNLIRGDARSAASAVCKMDLVVFSPPYPNSFDYTDVYNVELWMLGYIQNFSDNRTLRNATLSSHVQVKRDFTPAPITSRKLNKVLKKLTRADCELWSPHIPAMLGAYFAELSDLLRVLKPKLRTGASVWMVVGDSQYGGVRVDVAGILKELVLEVGYSVRHTEPFRSMRSSPQQGGREELPETLLVLDVN